MIKTLSILVLMIVFFLQSYAQINRVSFSDDSLRKSEECVISNVPLDVITCENSTAIVDFQSEGNRLLWYQNLHDTEYFLAKGGRFETPVLFANTRYFVQAVCPYFDSQKMNLETHWRGENGKNGIMFSVYAKEDVNLQSFDIHIVDGRSNCHIYYMAGSYDMQINNPNAWTLLSEQIIEGKGKGEPVNIEIPELKLEAGMTYGFYLSLDEDDVVFYSVGVRSFEDEHLILGNGKGVSWPFSFVCGAREFNGRLNYTVGEKPKSIKYPVEIEVIEKPHSPVLAYRGTAFESCCRDSFVWYCNGKELPVTTAICVPEEAGMYSVASYTGQCLSEQATGLFYDNYDQFISHDDLSVYPNPVVDVLNVDLSETDYFVAELFLIDANGGVMNVESIQGGVNNRIDLSSIESGRYMLTVNLNNQKITTQILKR